jgi:Zn-dependent peptidase ImmA (M78 family)
MTIATKRGLGKITLQPDCLKWARQRVNLSPAEIARKIGVKEETVLAWEQTGEITLVQAEKLAHVTYTPFGYLLLPQPPVEKLPVQDFRTFGSSGMPRVSPDLIDTLNEALRRQDWYREYLIENGIQPLAFVGSIQTSDPVDRAAGQIRSIISWDAELRSRSSNWEVALEEQVDAVESAGILVMQNSVVGQNSHRPLQVSEFRGFALCDNYAPLVFLNSRDSKAARMFTLAHEVVHIWLGESGVSNLNQTLPLTGSVVVEQYCNAAAAELLVPQVEIEAQWSHVRLQTDPVKDLARYFKVSSLVILRRLRDARILSDEEFRRQYSDELSVIAQHTVDRKSAGGNYYHTLRSRLGKRFTSALVESTLEGATQFREAYELLGVRNTDTFKNFAQLVTGAAS